MQDLLSTSSVVDVGQIFPVLDGDDGYHPVVGVALNRGPSNSAADVAADARGMARRNARSVPGEPWWRHGAVRPTCPWAPRGSVRRGTSRD